MKTFILFFLSLVMARANGQPDSFADGHIHPWPGNPHYLSWGDTPVFPLGAAGYHSWTPISRPATVNFNEQFERLANVINSIGSPHVCGFVRCLPYDPMNHMHDGEVTEVLQPWVRLDNGKYDLERIEPAWEKRLRAYLDAALRHRFVVSLELWDDWSVSRGPGGAYDPGKGNGWNAHPFNPKNNVNYDETVFPAETSVCNAPFYSTIPVRNNNIQVLNLQKKYVDRLLSITSGYPNILLNISNESRAHLDWSRFWAEYLRERLPARFMIGEMPSTNRKDGGGECEHAFSPLTLATDPLYDFVDIAQGVSGHEFGAPHQQAIGGGERIFLYRKKMGEAGTVRPLVVSKDYSRDSIGGDLVLWSRFVSGAATARFHRLAGDHPESVRTFQHAAVERLGRFIAEVPFWKMVPAPEIVRKIPEGVGVNVLAGENNICVIQLAGASGGGSFHLRLSPGTWTVRWINPATGKYLSQSEVSVQSDLLKMDIPEGPGHRIALLKKKTDGSSN